MKFVLTSGQDNPYWLKVEQCSNTKLGGHGFAANVLNVFFFFRELIEPLHLYFPLKS